MKGRKSGEGGGNEAASPFGGAARRSIPDIRPIGAYGRRRPIKDPTTAPLRYLIERGEGCWVVCFYEAATGEILAEMRGTRLQELEPMAYAIAADCAGEPMDNLPRPLNQIRERVSPAQANPPVPPPKPVAAPARSATRNFPGDTS